MNLEPPHLHIMLNHVPVLGTIFALLLGAYGLLRRREEVLRAALAAFVVVGFVALPTYFSGEEAEEIVEEIPGVDHERIERHEDAAFWAATGCGVVGALALVVLATGRRGLARGPAAAILLLAAALSGWLAYTANLGGEIRHPEIRAGGSNGETLDAAAAEEADDDGGQRRRRRGRDDG